MYVEPKTIARLIETGSRIVVARAGDGRGGTHVGRRTQTVTYRRSRYWDAMCGTATTVNYTVLCVAHLKFAKNVDLKHSHHPRGEKGK